MEDIISHQKETPSTPEGTEKETQSTPEGTETRNPLIQELKQRTFHIYHEAIYFNFCFPSVRVCSRTVNYTE